MHARKSIRGYAAAVLSAALVTGGLIVAPAAYATESSAAAEVIGAEEPGADATASDVNGVDTSPAVPAEPASSVEAGDSDSVQLDADQPSTGEADPEQSDAGENGTHATEADVNDADARDSADQDSAEQGDAEAVDAADAERDPAQETGDGGTEAGRPSGDDETADDADSAQPAAEAPFEVAQGSLQWGVKESFRNYIYSFTAFEGRTVLLGDVRQAAQTGDDAGVFHWAAGQGNAERDGSAADIAFAGADGVHFQSHPMDTDGDGKNDTYALDMTFTAPHVVITSPTTAELRMDVHGYEFEGMTAVGPEYTLHDAAIANLSLPAPSASDDGLTWTAAPATLTDEGSIAFGGFYQAGEALDPVTFSTLALERPAPHPQPVPVAKTTTTLTASAAAATAGESVQLTATVAAKAKNGATPAGTVQFMQNDEPLGKPVAVKNGRATLAAKKLQAGSHRFTAAFTPTNPAEFAASSSKAVGVKVTKSQPAGVKTVDVSSATLDWGVKQSFRNYIYNFTAFEGKTRLLGNVSQKAQTNDADGIFRWNQGSGTMRTDGSRGDVSFGAGNGVHFQSHPMTVDGKTVHALDMTFTNPHIVVTSPSTGELRMDVDGYEFVNMTSVGPKFSYTDTVVATLDLPTPTADADGTALTWTGAPATLTATGAKAFGDFYQTGEKLDPVTFSLAAKDAQVSTKKPTTTTLTASAEKVDEGGKVTLTAKTGPKTLAGTVAFSYGGTKIGKPVAVKDGTAKIAAELPVGIHSVLATFTPSNPAYGHSVSNGVTITVQQKQGEIEGRDPEAPAKNGKDGQAAGSLTWSISNAFRAYTTCENREAFGYSHCAKGTIDASGVGAGYRFPQALSDDWDAKAQTGTVSYSGTVAFSGYGQTMFSVTNPSITVTGPTTATLNTGYAGSYGPSSVPLDLAAATKTVGDGGAVTWSNVPVQGGLMGISDGQSIGFDSLSFTVGAESSETFGSSKTSGDDTEYTAADTAPSTTGVTVLTDAAKIREGGRIRLEAPGFDADDSGVLVVLYGAGSDGEHGPVVLDDNAAADENGVVTWSGTLPDDVTGAHIITLQGSTDAGAPIDILAADAKHEPRITDAAAATADSAVRETAVAAGVLGPAPGMALWEWWASAAGLLVIAACTTTLAVRQRRVG